MMKLTEQQDILRGLIEVEIRSNSKFSYGDGTHFRNKHERVYENFFNRYGNKLSEKKRKSETTIDFITRIDMLEELYQVALTQNGKRETNEYLKRKYEKEQQELNNYRNVVKAKEEKEKQEQQEQQEKAKKFGQFKDYIHSISKFPKKPHTENQNLVIEVN